MTRLLVLAVIGCACLLPTSSAHARTEGGDLLWQDTVAVGGGFDQGHAIAATSGRVVAVSDKGLRAYDARTGALLWTDAVSIVAAAGSASAQAWRWTGSEL